MKSLRSLLNTQFAAGLVAVAVLAAASLWGTHQLDRQAVRALVAKDVTADILPPPMYLIETRLVLSQAAEGSMDMGRAAAEIDRLEREYLERVQHWTENPPYGLQAQLLGAQHEAAKAFLDTARHRVLPALRGHDGQAVQAALREAHALYLRHREGVDTTVATAGAFAAEAEEGFAAAAWATVAIAVGAAATGLAALLLLFVWTRRTVWQAVGAEPAVLARVAQAAAEGDYTQSVATEHPHSVASALERMRANIVEVVSAVRSSADSVATASAQIAHGTQDLSARTENQAAALQQAAATMSQVDTTVRSNADGARQADALAREAAGIAARGGTEVADLVRSMQGIDASAKKIGEIIGVIDNIAFRTNILALNAAVEAARAGEQGRGFAVVASEVRALAQRSGDAAREIRDLIAGSLERTEQGATVAARAGGTMQEVVNAIQRVSQVVAEITAASAEQSQGVRQVGDAVAQLDNNTQQNAALVEQSAAAAESLRQQAAQLVQAVAVFRLARAAGA